MFNPDNGNDMAKFRVSVLCAVYGLPERMLREGLDCLLRQTLKEVEFLLINDCSPDDFTHRVLQEYAAKDPRFRVIENKANIGLPAVRNIALEHSRGKYFTMIDPDDLVPDNYLEILCGVAEYYDCDMVTCRFHEFQDGETMDLRSGAKVSDFCRLSRPLPVRKMFRQKFVCRLFRMSTIGDLRFDHRLRRGSDLLFIHQYLVRCRRTLDLDYVGYFYRHGRIFAAGETKIPPRVVEPIPLCEQEEASIVGFGDLLAQCRTEEEKRFVSYMAVRRYLRCLFWVRHFPAEVRTDTRRKFQDFLDRSTGPILLQYGRLGKCIHHICAHASWTGIFLAELQLFRLLFELRHAGYHLRFAWHKIKVCIYRAA